MDIGYLTFILMATTQRPQWIVMHIKGVPCPHWLLLKALSSLLRPQLHRTPGPGQGMGKEAVGEDEKIEALELPVWARSSLA